MFERCTRRRFLAGAAGVAAAATVGASESISLVAGSPDQPLFGISLAEWSLHRTLFSGRRNAGEILMDHLDFARVSKEKFGIEAVEYVNQFFVDKAEDQAYLQELKQRQDDVGVIGLLIMIDGEGYLGDPDEAARLKAVANHHKWVDAAKFLGCHSIRVNAYSRGSFEETQRLAADGLRRLSEYAKPRGINIIVENHGGLSSNGQWLMGVMKAVGMDNCGTLPDFGNFSDYDRYQGVEEMMPLAKAVSAKSHEFDDEGNEVRTDYWRMMKIVLDAGYRGYVGIEYEGSQLSEADGIMATKRLLERVREAYSDKY